MFIVITGLDGSGTSSIAKGLNEIDLNSVLLKSPSKVYSDRNLIDDMVRKESGIAHLLYYLSSTVYASDYIKNNCDYKNNNVYLVRYLIDTVVSNRVAGFPIDLDYNIYGNRLLEPDLTLFVQITEDNRKERIIKRGMSSLDKVLEDEIKRKKFLEEFNRLLIPDKTIYVDNNQEIEKVVKNTYKKILTFKGV